MLEPRNELCLDLESAEKLGMVRPERLDDLDRDLATYGRLVGAMYNTEWSRTHLRSQLIARNPSCGPRQWSGWRVRSEFRELGGVAW